VAIAYLCQNFAGMLQLAFIRNNKEKVVEALKKKNFKDLELIEKIIEADDNRKNLQFQSDEKLAQRNTASKDIGALLAQGKKEEAEAKKQEVSALKASIDEISGKLAETEALLEGLLLRLPNLPNDLVPTGLTAEDNEVVRTHGDIPKLYEGAVPHWDLITKYDLVDFQTGVKITGSGFALYKGRGAKLQRALIQYFFGLQYRCRLYGIHSPTCGQLRLCVWNRSASRQGRPDVPYGLR